MRALDTPACALSTPTLTTSIPIVHISPQHPGRRTVFTLGISSGSGSPLQRKQLGLPISETALDEIKQNLVRCFPLAQIGYMTDGIRCAHTHEQHLDVEQFEVAVAEEKKRRHDVMAHMHTFSTVAPSAAGIIQSVLLISCCPPLSNRWPVITVSARHLAMLQSEYDLCDLSYF